MTAKWGGIRSPAGNQEGTFWKQLVEYLVVFQAAHHEAEVGAGWNRCRRSRAQHSQRSVLVLFGHNGYLELQQFLQTHKVVAVLDIIHPSDLQQIWN